MGELRYLSANSLKSFLTCPFQGKLAYVNRLRPAVPKAVLAFGTVVHMRRRDDTRDRFKRIECL